MDILMCIINPLEIHRINKFIQIHFQCLCPGFSEIFLTHAGIFHDLHVLIHDQNNVWRSLHHQIRQGFCLIMHIRNAHIQLRLLLEHCYRLVTAGRITAGTAI